MEQTDKEGKKEKKQKKKDDGTDEEEKEDGRANLKYLKNQNFMGFVIGTVKILLFY